MKRANRILIVGFFIVVNTACGGGGSSVTTGPPPPPPPSNTPFWAQWGGEPSAHWNGERERAKPCEQARRHRV